MADFYTSKWGNNYSPQVRLSVGVANLNGGTARVTWILDYVTSGYAAYTNGVARSWSIAIDGQVRSGTFNINGISSTTRISSGTIDVARGTSARNIAVSASFNFDVTWAGSYSGSRTASGSVGIERKVSYTVSFNANGGSGAPGSQTRWYGEVITLSSTRPTRYGYIFQGWAKSASGAVEYQPGSKYGLDANTTLYAIWKAETYAVSFNANGGSGAPGNQTKTYGQTLTLSSTKPTRTNYNFLGWATSSGSSTAEYQAGGSYTNNAAVTLYAVWQLAYTPPRVTNVRSDRCNSASTLTEEGTYVKVTFNWATDYNISAIYIRHKASNSSTWATTTVSATGKVGSVTQVIGSNGINTEYMYNIQIEVRDSVGSSTVNQDVPAMSYVIDFKTGGKGVAIGKPATRDNLFDVSFESNFDKNLKTSGVFYQKGKTLLDTFYPVGSIFITTVNTNPSSYMGGSWVRFGNGQTLVGVNESDTDFNTVQKTGGAKSHTIDYDNLPARTGKQVSWKGGLTSYSEWKSGNLAKDTWIMSNSYDTQTPWGKAISNLQPYITVYMWRRTA